MLRYSCVTLAMAQTSLMLIFALLLLLCLLIALRLPRLAAWFNRKYSHWSGLILGLLGVLVLCFGLIGFGHREGREFDSIASAAYATAQLFSLNTPLEELRSDSPPSPPQRVNPGSVSDSPSSSNLPAPSERAASWYLSWAKLFATAFVLTIATQAIGALFHDSYQKLQLSSAARHVVICGLGRIGRQIIHDLIERRDQRAIILIESDPENRYLPWAREQGILIIIGDATRSESLLDARILRASELFIVTGSDENNIECVVELRDIFRDSRDSRSCRSFWNRSRPRLRCRVHILNRDLAEILRERTTDLEGNGELIDIEVFNALERTARRLLEDLVVATPQRPSLRPTLPDQVAHYVVLGFGDFGQTLALQLAELAHFENRKRLRLTILDHHIEDLARPFLARYPGFAPEYSTCGPWKFLAEADQWDSRSLRPVDAARADDPRAIEYVCNAGFEELTEVTDDRFIRNLNQAFDRPGVRPAILVCFEEDRKNFALAERLKSKLRTEGQDWPIFVWIPRQRELSQLLIEKQIALVSNRPPGNQERELLPFGECNGSVAYQEITRSWSEWLARHLELSYQQHYSSPKLPVWEAREAAFKTSSVHASENANVDWKSLDIAASEVWSKLLNESFRASDRSAANHSVVKLATLNRRIQAVNMTNRLLPVSINVPADLDDALRTMEHYRWVSERLLAGWRYHAIKDKVKKRHPQLIPWEDLTDGEKLKDQTSVELLLGLCRLGKLTTEDTMTDQTENSTLPHPRIAVVGPSGCGKTTIGIALADEIQAVFLDADDFHSIENKARMSSGQGLTDELRRPWLADVRNAVEQAARHSAVVVACSALKPDLRQQLSHGDRAWRFVALDVDAETLMHRLTTRTGHFFPASLLESQLTTWKPLTPEEGFAVDGTRSIPEIVREIRHRLESEDQR